MPERTASESTDPTDFSDLEEKDSSFYTAQGSGSMAGTSFTTEDGSVACHITGRAAACVVPGNQAAWDNADRADDGLEGTGAPLNVVGWDPAVQADFGQKPKVWTQQGTFPHRSDVELPNGSMLSVLVNQDTTVECGVRDNTVTCTDGTGSFTVSGDSLSTS